MSKLKGKIAGSLVAAGAFLYASPVFAAIIEDPKDAGTRTGGLTLATLIVLLNRIVDVLMIIGVVLGAIFIVVGGIRYIFAGGESEKADKAKTQLLNGIIGVAVVLGVGLIVNTLIKLFTTTGGIFTN